MDFKDSIRMAIEEYLLGLRKALDSLSKKERRFQPTPEANHIDFIVWHMARTEDDYTQAFAGGKQSVWQRDRWHARMGLTESGSGFRYTPHQVAELPTFDFGDLMDYFAAVRKETLRYLDGLSAGDLEARPARTRWPERTVGWMLGHLVVEQSQHLGQIAYLRGLQRGQETPFSWPNA